MSGLQNTIRASFPRVCLPTIAVLIFTLLGCTGDPLDGHLDTGLIDGGLDADFDSSADADGDETATDAADDSGETDADDDRLCPANGDGILQREEILVSFDLALLYRAAPTGNQVPVDLVGTTEDGERVWHFEESVPGERVVEEQARVVEGTWFAENFPSATHLAPLNEQHGYDGVYRLDDDALWLLGFVSAEGQGTRVTYDPPVPLVRFPLHEGDSWTVTTTGSGRMSWVLFYDTEEYTLTVDAIGTVVVPAGRYPALRIRSELTQTIGLLQTRRIAYTYMSECWGRVAHVASRDNERELEFGMATDYRRLSFE